MLIDRGRVLQAATATFAATLLPRCLARSADGAASPPHEEDNGDGGTSAAEADIDFEAPRLVTTTLGAGFVRSFSGGAYPQNLRFRRTTGEWVKLYDLFPNAHDPFAISTRHETGAGGFALSVTDRAASRIMPDTSVEPWALAMVPFGVVLDGSILDPSGPWYDGGPADPQNPMDRKCSGWQYDPISALRKGTRAAVPHTNPALVPPGTYDGTFVADWVYAPDEKRAQIEAALASTGTYLSLTKGEGDYRILDATNGFVTTGITVAEYDHEIYAYALTEDWPEIPRMLRFQPADSFCNVIPYDGGPRGGRKQLYDACPADLDVHQWDGRARY